MDLDNTSYIIHYSSPGFIYEMGREGKEDLKKYGVNSVDPLPITRKIGSVSVYLKTFLIQHNKHKTDGTIWNP